MSTHQRPEQADPREPDGTSQRHVLVIEDDVDLADLLATWLRAHYGDRVAVHIAHSVADGHAELQRLHRLDLVLLDRKFPEGCGDELLDAIARAFDPITVMITGVAPDVDVIRLPITDYLVKPVDEETVVKRLSLLEKLQAANVLTDYANARKASLLEYHLDEPDDHPLFRRFAARWSYDRLEAVDTGEQVLIYELYLDQGEGPDRDISVSVVGTLGVPVADAVEAGDLRPVGELVPSGNDHAWLDVDGTAPVEPADGGFVIYEFATATPEELVADDIGPETDVPAIETMLERTYA